MGIKSMIRFCYVTLAVILISTNASAMISGEEDYQRADTLHRLADKVYSLGVVPEWIGDSHYFWYKNRERTGSVFYHKSERPLFFGCTLERIGCIIPGMEQS